MTRPMDIAAAGTAMAGARLSEEASVSVQKKALDQQKQQGENAMKLIEAAGGQALPPGATFSVRV